MSKKFFGIIFILIIGIFFLPKISQALIYTNDEFKNLEKDKTTLVKVYLNTEGKEINVLEGSLKVKGPVEVLGINTTDSVFSLWPEDPKIENDEIIFIGGLPGGVYGADLRLFDLYLKRIDKGKISVKIGSAFGYLNNGQGTKIEIAKIGNSIDKIKEEFNWGRFLNALLVLVIVFTLVNTWKVFRKNK